MKNKLNGIEPIIAVVILVAVTLVIAIAVVGWIMGWWGAAGAPGESLKITPLNATNKEVSLYICNQGGASAKIQSAIIKGVVINADGKIDPTNIDAGACETVKITVQNLVSLTTGETVEIQILTTAGNTYKTVVRVS